MPFMTMRSDYTALRGLPVRFAKDGAQRNWCETAPEFASLPRPTLTLAHPTCLGSFVPAACRWRHLFVGSCHQGDTLVFGSARLRIEVQPEPVLRVASQRLADLEVGSSATHAIVALDHFLLRR